MTRYIDAEKIPYTDLNADMHSKVRVYVAFKERIDRVPTADVVERKDLDTITEAHEQIGYEKGYRDGYAQATVEVVRCKECKYFCKASKYCSDFLTQDEEGFCKWGERREE